MPTENKMTPTPWGVFPDGDGTEIGIQRVGDYADVIASLFCEPMDDETKANASAIVSAVNNTYGAGINPEIVSGMAVLYCIPFYPPFNLLT